MPRETEHSQTYENVVGGIRRRWQVLTLLKNGHTLVQLSCGHEIEEGPEFDLIRGNQTFTCPHCRSRNDSA